MSKKTSDAGINLIKSFEGCVLKAYRCPAGVLTIGYGHTSGVKDGMVITADEAVVFLKSDLASFEKSVNSLVKVDITQNMFDALVSFTYNCGAGALKKSTLLLLLNSKNYSGAAGEFAKWNKANGKVLAGLTRRRTAERLLFVTDMDDVNTSTESTDSSTVSYKKGNYITQYAMRVRTGPGTSYPVKNFTAMTADAQKENAQYKVNGKAIYKKGLTFTAQSIVVNADSVWAKTPSGYVCLKDNNTIYAITK